MIPKSVKRFSEKIVLKQSRAAQGERLPPRRMCVSSRPVAAPGAVTAMRRKAVLLLALALPLALAALPAALPSSAASPASPDAVQGAARCLGFGSAIAMPVLVFLVAMGRRHAGPPGFGALPAVAAALAGVLGLELHCPDASPSHLMMGHAPIMLILLLLLLLARYIGTRSSAGATRQT